MNFWTEILISAAFLASLYFVFRVMLVLFAEHELDGSSNTRRRDDAIEVFAEAESMEYYVRCALVAAREETAVVIYVKKDSALRDEMLDTISKLRRHHKNLSYRLI